MYKGEVETQPIRKYRHISIIITLDDVETLRNLDIVNQRSPNCPIYLADRAYS